MSQVVIPNNASADAVVSALEKWHAKAPNAHKDTFHDLLVDADFVRAPEIRVTDVADFLEELGSLDMPEVSRVIVRALPRHRLVEFVDALNTETNKGK